MAILNKKLKIKDASGNIVDCNIYTTQTEAGSTALNMKVDGESTFVAMGGGVSAYGATKGRAKINGETYAILSESKPPYTEKSWTIAGTYTFTVPSGITRIRVAVCGGGGGSCGHGMGSTTLRGEAGGISSFGNLITATGGGGGYLYIDGSTIKGEAHGTGGNPNGESYEGESLSIKGLPSSFGGHALSFINESGSYGQAVRVKQSGRNYITFTYGGGGGYNSNYIDVIPSTTYKITVGKGGNATNYNLMANTDITNLPYSEGNGFVLIAYGGDI